MDVEEYRRTRYKGMDQKIVNRKEGKILEKIFQTTGDKTISILDVPCGYGRFTELLREKSHKLTSADVSFPMVLTAKKYFPSPDSSHHFLVGDIKHLPLEDNSFDCIVTIRLFQHILNSTTRFQILQELHRVAKEIVIISFYRCNLLHSIERWVRCRIKNVNKKISMLPLGDFEKELSSIGFKLLNIFPVIRYFHAHNIVLLKKL
ncbi:MAG: class I SAM-dependent methyltransferase [Elusimicrobiota bacterium]|nr:class I SAM-dependent methyltransferase [Elusimicrobiota bacterium]